MEIMQMPLQSLTKEDLDVLHRALEEGGIFPLSSQEEFPIMLAEMIEMKFVTVIVTPEEIRLDVKGGIVSCTILRAQRG